MVVSRLLGAGHGVKRESDPGSGNNLPRPSHGVTSFPRGGGNHCNSEKRSTRTSDYDGHDHHVRSPCLHHAAARFSGVSTPLASARIIHVKPHQSATQPPWM